MKASHFSPDTREFIELLARHGVRYVIVGGEAVIYHGYARLTGDVDFFYEASPGNAARLFLVLSDFWSGSVPGVNSADELLPAGTIIQFGVPPNRIDLVSSIDAVSFQEAWEGRVTEEMETEGAPCPVHYIGLDQLIKNKSCVKRFRDLEDLEYLLAKQKKKS